MAGGPTLSARVRRYLGSRGMEPADVPIWLIGTLIVLVWAAPSSGWSRRRSSSRAT